mmetsp:Transcript_12243/g.25270  ORF Transcript_12243/g.25270 Transcript_12243/m.25270 type:complete len:117 (+) Transcript_12243:165-515(+)|eukprot:CAMPEP_0197276030 /NCGR_PEP_ID=MMETSP1432-20130617/14719_1 /TAXON_ID=44447 /ORGANISM="Pseudo-nitzschia delicatissima, Strain UNC1205" /LENGTH=116 /DNA_ID=CAMNT_0042742009 /DNA_START=145 /DNA_END=495 /DNA_ORIENTATION=+
MPSLRDTSNFCARYSAVGMIFMLMVSLMLTYQPFYIGGIEDLKQAKSNAYGGVGSFLFVFLLSVVYLVIDALQGPDNERMESRHSMGNEYESVPTSGIGGPDLSLERMEFKPGQFT